ncbi:MAG: YbaN family protein [Bacteroidaceae bacterium]|nr:YbaN family protein [Bacteroidaceae bacterium]
MNILWSIVGIVAFSLGALGMFLPILPTTPFWLLAAFCLMKGSKRLYERAMRFAPFNSIITNFRIYGAIPLHAKIIAVSTLWITITISCILVWKWWVAVILLVVATAVTWHILSFPTLTKEMMERLRDERSHRDAGGE